MKVGDLVRVKWPSSINFVHLEDALGEVTDYRPDFLGGSGIYSWKGGDKWHHEMTTAPKRGEVRVLCYDDGSESWYDEQNVELVTE
jgi:hypothetical protein